VIGVAVISLFGNKEEGFTDTWVELGRKYHGRDT
jgi:hypothetical protein